MVRESFHEPTVDLDRVFVRMVEVTLDDRSCLRSSLNTMVLIAGEPDGSPPR